MHTVGTFSPESLHAIARYASRLRIRHSAETGSGASTLLFSQLSEHHTVFALDDGSGSIVNVQSCPLLRPGVVTFVEGPTQTTLPRYEFSNKLQLVLIDGPHAFPFPEMEYYFLYPHLDTGALLIVDDIHIRSIHHLFEFLREDAMFSLVQVVQTTAFFTRTDAPTFNPYGDGWWKQNYNAKPLLRWAWKQRLKELAPGAMRTGIVRFQRKVRANAGGAKISIVTPASGEGVGPSGEVEGTATLEPGSHLWVLVHRKDLDGWWPQGKGSVLIQQDRWRVTVSCGNPEDLGQEFEILAIAVGAPTHQLWTEWVSRVERTGEWPPVSLPPANVSLREVYRTVRKVR